MDNQQITSVINNNYFGGLIDSDFGVYIHEFYPRGHLQLRPTINFVNTNFDLIEFCSYILKANDINHHISFREATVGRDKKEIVIQRFRKCLDFTEKWNSFSIVRRPQLSLLKDFCYDRLRYVDEKGFKQNNTPYTDYQKNIAQQLKTLNCDYNYDTGFRNLTWAWLEGFLEGDGSICFVVSNDRIIPTIDFTTESNTALANIEELFTKNNIKFSVRVSRSRAEKRIRKGKPYKKCYNIYVRSFESLEILLERLKENLIGKAQQRDLVLEYLELKRDNKFNTNTNWQIVEKVKNLNNRRYPRDYTRNFQ